MQRRWLAASWVWGAEGFAAGAVGYAFEIGAGLAAGLGVAATMATGLPAKALNAARGPMAKVSAALAGPFASLKQAVRGPMQTLRNRFKGESDEPKAAETVAQPTPVQAIRSEIEVRPMRMMRHISPPLEGTVVAAPAPAPAPDNRPGMQ